MVGRLFSDGARHESNLLRRVASGHNEVGQQVGCEPLVVRNERQRFVSVDGMDAGTDTGEEFRQGFFHGCARFVFVSEPVLLAKREWQGVEKDGEKNLQESFFGDSGGKGKRAAR